MTHILKTWRQFFNDVKLNIKTFEVRKNDRNFQEGDTLMLQEYDPVSKTYTGAEVSRRVTYMLENFDGLADGYIVMGIEP